MTDRRRILAEWGEAFRNALKPIAEAKPRTLVFWGVVLIVYVYAMLQLRWLLNSAG